MCQKLTLIGYHDTLVWLLRSVGHKWSNREIGSAVRGARTRALFLSYEFHKCGGIHRSSLVTKLKTDVRTVPQTEPSGVDVRTT